MGFTQVQDLDASETTALGGKNKQTGKANPTAAEGYFLGSKSVESVRSKTGTCFLHILQTSEGNLGVWGKTDLDRKMKNVKPGTMVRITQNGMLEIPGKNPMYKFKVEVDLDNTIEVNLSGSNTDAEYSAYPDNEELPEESNFDSDDHADDITLAKPSSSARAVSSAPNTAQNVARTRGLLGGSASRK